MNSDIEFLVENVDVFFFFFTKSINDKAKNKWVQKCISYIGLIDLLVLKINSPVI